VIRRGKLIIIIIIIIGALPFMDCTLCTIYVLYSNLSLQFCFRKKACPPCRSHPCPGLTRAGLTG